MQHPADWDRVNVSALGRSDALPHDAGSGISIA
jgi:hypothetical protein